jgi:hypothetical protein
MCIKKDLNQPEKALQYLLPAYEVMRKHFQNDEENNQPISSILNNIGMTYDRLGKLTHFIM